MSEQAKPRDNFRILIADDDEDARILLNALLSNDSFSLTFCANGDEAIAFCKKSLPDLALLDVQMPGAGGLEVCKTIKKLSKNSFLPVLLITCCSDPTEKVEGFKAGADDYITKPFFSDELLARIQTFVRLKNTTDQLRAANEELAKKEELLTCRLYKIDEKNL